MHVRVLTAHFSNRGVLVSERQVADALHSASSLVEVEALLGRARYVGGQGPINGGGWTGHAGPAGSAPSTLLADGDVFGNGRARVRDARPEPVLGPYTLGGIARLPWIQPAIKWARYALAEVARWRLGQR